MEWDFCWTFAGLKEISEAYQTESLLDRLPIVRARDSSESSQQVPTNSGVFEGLVVVGKSSVMNPKKRVFRHGRTGYGSGQNCPERNGAWTNI